MKCPNCGKENPAGEQFCLDCGSDLTAQPASAGAPAVAAQPPSAASTPYAMSDEEFQRLLNSPPARTCPHCGAPAPATGNYCDHCGEPLDATAGTAASTPAAASASASQAAPSSAAAAAPADAPPPASQPPTAPIVPAATAPAAPPQPAGITLELSGPAASSTLAFSGSEMHVGRRDADAGIYPEIDFDGNDIVVDAGERVHAVSRRHGRIFRDGDVLKYEDVGSTNGSTINGTPVLPNDPQPLKDGDRIVLGRTCRITVHIA
jgi:hypothetical protein